MFKNSDYFIYQESKGVSKKGKGCYSKKGEGGYFQTMCPSSLIFHLLSYFFREYRRLSFGQLYKRRLLCRRIEQISVRLSSRIFGRSLWRYVLCCGQPVEAKIAAMYGSSTWAFISFFFRAMIGFPMFSHYKKQPGTSKSLITCRFVMFRIQYTLPNGTTYYACFIVSFIYCGCYNDTIILVFLSYNPNSGRLQLRLWIDALRKRSNLRPRWQHIRLFVPTRVQRSPLWR